MSDLIDRQEAIGILDQYTATLNPDRDNTELGRVDRIMRFIEQLPSAQPEIIRCNSCKYWTQTTGEMKGYGLGWCDFHEAHMVTCNGFCYLAEREKDER